MGLHIHHFDVETAFLYGNYEETLYMEQPDGLYDGTCLFYRQSKSLYGLEQAPLVRHKPCSRQ